MGTRNLICVYHERKYKLAKYCQWDGDPSGQGIKILDFLKNFDKNLFIKQLDKVRKLTKETEDKIIEEYRLIDTKNKMDIDYPEISIDTGYEILSLILDNKKEDIYIRDSLNFAANSLFCEWCYVIDFDKNTYEVYEGWNKDPLDIGERFKFLETTENLNLWEGKSYIYYPVKLLTIFNLSDLPDKEQFLNSCNLEDY